MRCNECEKFVSTEQNDPEIEELEIDNDGDVRVEVHIVDVCAECGQELREHIFEVSENVELSGEEDHEHELEITEGDSERINRKDKKTGKAQVGFRLGVTITCTGCDERMEYSLEEYIDVAAMDEM